MASKSYKSGVSKDHQVFNPTDQTVCDLEVPTKSYASFIERSLSCLARCARIPYKESSWIARHVRNISRCSRTFQDVSLHEFSSSNRIQSNTSMKIQDRKDLIRFWFAFRPPWQTKIKRPYRLRRKSDWGVWVQDGKLIPYPFQLIRTHCHSNREPSLLSRTIRRFNNCVSYFLVLVIFIVCFLF